ncbi:MAG: nucleotidyltransferase family protein [Alteraurantiacibacter sp.]
MPKLDPSIGIILLAAGRGRRYGRDKLQEIYRGRPLWTWAAKAADEAGFVKRYLVRREHSSVGNRAGWQDIINPDADEGMGTSIAAGVDAGQSCSRLVVTLADMPLVEPEHLVRLALGSGTVFTRYTNGNSGSPAAFPSSAFCDLRSLSGEAGARCLSLAGVSAIEPCNNASLSDVDTEADLISLSS